MEGTCAHDRYWAERYHDHDSPEEWRLCREVARLKADVQVMLEQASETVSAKIDPMVKVPWMRCSPRLPDYVANLEKLVEDLQDQTNRLRGFKEYVHKRLDEAEIPGRPDGPHTKKGCRVGDRLDIALSHKGYCRLCELGGTMVRDGENFGYGHYGHDGAWFGLCKKKIPDEVIAKTIYAFFGEDPNAKEAGSLFWLEVAKGVRRLYGERL